MPRARLLIGVALAAFGLNGAAATANIYSTVLRSYQVHGYVPACYFTSGQLQAALKQTDTYGAQYFSDFTAAVKDALQSRATGACAVTGNRRSRRLASPPLPRRLPPVLGATSAGLPAPVVLMASLLAAVLVLAAGLALARWRAWDPAWAGPWRHLLRETGYRARILWAEFSDWLRSRSG